MIFSVKLKRIALVVVSIIFIISASIFIDKSIFTIKTSPVLEMTIVIDPGHGGVDAGAIGKTTHTTEKELNLIIAQKLKSYLDAGGFRVILTRETDAGLYGVYSSGYKKRDMEARKEIIEKSDACVMISIHMNSFIGPSSRGAQVFYADNNPNSVNLANSIQQIFKNDIPASDKGSSIGDYYILKCTEIPSVLCECGYLSNPTDEALLCSSEHQDKLAYSIYKGIVTYLNIGNSEI